MAVVTIDAAAQVARSSGATGWSARGTFEVPDLDVSQLAHTTATAVGNISTQTRVAQSFTTGSAYSLAAVRILIQKNTAPTDNWSVEIYADASNLPTGAALATSDLIASADISTTIHWHEFVFSSPPSLSSGTKYWIALKRSGALDASNYLQWRLSTASSYASGGRSVDNAGVWGAESAASDQAFETVKTTKSLYQVTQDTGGSPEFHMYKSTDNAASWSEVDTGNGPTVFNTAYPWSADWAKAGLNNTGEGNAIVLAYFTNTNTMRARAFNIGSQTWATADLNAADATTAAVNTRPVRMILNSIEQQIFFTATADDADISRAQRLAAAWQATAIYFAATSANQSSLSDMVKDRTSFGAASSTGRFLTGFVYDAAGGDDFSVQTVTSSTNGTITDLDAAAAVGSSKHASATYHTYSGAGGVDTVIAAYIDSDDTLEERTAQLEVTAASITLGTQHAVGTSTSYAGRQLSTCKFGSDLYIFASTGTGIDYYKDTGASGTWGSVNNWKSGLTNCFLSQATPITGVGILVVYNDNGDVKCDVLTSAVGATGTVSTGSHSVTGQAIAATYDTTGTVATGSRAITGQTVTGTPTVAGNVSTGSHAVTGQAIAATTGATGTIGAGSHAVSGQAIAATTGTVGTIATGSLVVAGQAIAGTVTTPATGTVTTGSHAVTGQTVTATAGVVATVTTGAHTVAGQAVVGTTGTVATVASGSLTVSGQAIAGTTGHTGTVATGSLSVSGQTITGVAGGAATGTVTTGAHTVTGQTISATTGTSATITTGAHSVTGQAITGTTGHTGTVSSGSLAVTGQVVGGTTGVVGTTTTGVVSVSGQAIAATTGVGATVTTGSLSVSGQTITGTGAVAGTETGTVSSGTLSVSGQGITATSGVTAILNSGTLTVSGQSITSTTGSVGAVSTGGHAVTGQTIEASATAGTTTGTIATGVLLIDGQVVVSGTSATVVIATGTYAVSGQTITVTIIGTGDVEGRLLVDLPLTATIVVTQLMTAHTTTGKPIEAQTTTDAVLSGRFDAATPVTARLEEYHG
jgi:hypothetical protein